MSFPSVRPSDRAPLVGVINPQSLAPGTATSGWIDMGLVGAILASLNVGAIAATGTLNAKLEQATDSAGTGAKDVTGKAITALADSDDNKQIDINCRPDELDIVNGFTHVRLSVTTATAASLVGAQVRAFDSRYQPQADLATVAQVVG